MEARREIDYSRGNTCRCCVSPLSGALLFSGCLAGAVVFSEHRILSNLDREQIDERWT